MRHETLSIKTFSFNFFSFLTVMHKLLIYGNDYLTFYNKMGEKGNLSDM